MKTDDNIKSDCNSNRDDVHIHTVDLSVNEWQTIKPAVTATGHVKLVDWVNLFSQKMQSFDRTCYCTLKGCYHVVSRSYRDGCVLDKAGVLSGVMMCTNKCKVRIKSRSLSINPMDSTRIEFAVSGYGRHSNNHIKVRQLRGAARIVEVACAIDTVSERRAQLVRNLGAFSSRVHSNDVLSKARSEVRVALRGSLDELEELRVLHKMKPTFIRCVEVIPFCVMMWLNSQLECYREKVKRSGQLELFMDATSGKVKRIDGKDVYATSLVLASGQMGYPQIPVAMMLSNCHNTPSYTSFLQRWWSSVNRDKAVDLPARHRNLCA